ncbi:aldehyde dehydrogenase family protein [Natronomonas sp. F2-12]|uniref:Aldehyde dehydrogenase family protein n=1 Tax=Natronomonas aquatica TaxID=2841590 RepID=A0A9R1CQR2_9EURY|nr:aldehyde dehydrogenase family protein [Natronomonas aquatica]MCQ4332088.1 aldehyde dehydrogenase family protein [Natronomonas aquatica]
MSADYRNYIDGEWVESESDETIEVRNPADTTEVVGTYQRSTEADTERAIEAANDAAEGWAKTPGPERGRILRETAGILESRKEELVETLVREEGKTRSEAGEVGRSIDLFYYYAEKARDIGGPNKQSSGEKTELSVRKEPLGVAGLITPWNYPSAIPAWKIAPALATGNTVALKPASAAPGPARQLVEALDEAGVPDGVVNLVTGPGSEVGNTISSHPAVDVVSFTGSSAVGERVYETASGDQKRVQCEMGGKNPTIVMPSADLDQATEIVAGGAFGVTGQACTACSRAIVHEDVSEQFLDQIVAHAESIEIGPGLEDPDMGPHISESELDGTLEYIDIANGEGATLETGGGRPEGSTYENGYFVEPTVFSDVDPEDRIAQEEVFGPVLSVIEVGGFEEALEVANGVEYGLSSSIVTQDLDEAHRFVDETESGVAKVNDKTTGVELHVPFGGYKRSSTNTYREQGDAGIDFYTAEKTVYLNY